MWVFDTLYPWYRQYPVLDKRPSRFVLAVWELLLAKSARSESTSLTSVVLSRDRVSRLLYVMEIAEALRDPDVAALATASEILFK